MGDNLSNNGGADHALRDQIKLIGDSMQREFTEVKGQLKSIETRVRAIETAEAGSHPIITNRLDAAWRKLDDHEAKILVAKNLVDNLDTRMVAMKDDIKDHEQENLKFAERLKKAEDTLISLATTNKILAWVAGILGGAVLLYVMNGILNLL